MFPNVNVLPVYFWYHTEIYLTSVLTQFITSDTVQSKYHEWMIYSLSLRGQYILCVLFGERMFIHHLSI